MFILRNILLVGLLQLILVSGLLAQAVNIPTLKCAISFSSISALNGIKNPERLKALSKSAELIEAGEGIAKYLLFAANENIRPEPAMTILMESNFVKKMDFSKEELQSAYSELIITQKQKDIDLDIAAAKLIKNVSAYREGRKTYSSKRPYDSFLELIEVDNQCRLGSCWAYAAKSTIELTVKYFKAQAKTEPKKYGHFKDISEKELYTAIEPFYGSYVINELKKLVKRGDYSAANELFQQGGSFKGFMAYASTFGAGIPKSQWKALKSYKTAMYKDAFMAALKQIAQSHHEKITEIKSSNQDANTKSKLINKEAEIAFNEIEAKVESYTKDLDTQKIIVNGKALSTFEFHQNYLMSIVNTLEVFNMADFTYLSNSTRRSQVEIVDRDPNHRLRSEYPSFPYRNHNLSEKDFETMIKTHIDSGVPLYISVKIPVSTYTNPKTGKMENIIDGRTGLTTMEFVPRHENIKIRGGHALVITGYEVNTKGKITTLRIQNSWGKEHGDGGVLHMDISFVSRMLKQVIAFDTKAMAELRSKLENQ